MKIQFNAFAIIFLCAIELIKKGVKDQSITIGKVGLQKDIWKGDAGIKNLAE